MRRSTRYIWTTRSRAAGCCLTCCAARASSSPREGTDNDAAVVYRSAVSSAEHVKPCPIHKIYPYLLGGVAVERPNQDLVHGHHLHPMARGFIYLAAMVDWFSRRVLAWWVSITMEVDSGSKRSKRR
jgi:hypothetical protein